MRLRTSFLVSPLTAALISRSRSGNSEERAETIVAVAVSRAPFRSALAVKALAAATDSEPVATTRSHTSSP